MAKFRVYYRDTLGRVKSKIMKGKDVVTVRARFKKQHPNYDYDSTELVR